MTDKGTNTVTVKPSHPVPAKLTSKQHRKRSDASEATMLKIGKRQSSCLRSLNDADAPSNSKQVCSKMGSARLRKKALEKETANAKKVLKRQFDAATNAEVLSPDFRGNLPA